MATNCKDIIVTIAAYDPTSTYIVVVRLIDSLGQYPIIPTYTQTATGPILIFEGLPDGEYQVGIRRTCAEGGVTPWIWQPVAVQSCTVPAGYVINTITANSANLAWTADASVSFQYRVDRVGPFLAAGASSQALVSLATGKVYEAEIRKKCGLYSFSLPLIKSFATTVGAPTFRVDIMEKVCEGNLFVGYRIRFSVTGGVAASSSYRIRFTDFFGTTSIIQQANTGLSDPIYDLIQKLAAPFVPINMIVGSNYAAFDILSRELEAPPGVSVNCQDVDLTTGYLVDII